jgi:hypothetical protein
MTDAQAYHQIIGQLEDLHSAIEKSAEQFSHFDDVALVFARRRALDSMVDTYHDQHIFEAYRREFVEYSEILKGIRADVEFFNVGLSKLENL